jgi:hypothetical protein
LSLLPGVELLNLRLARHPGIIAIFAFFLQLRHRALFPADSMTRCIIHKLASHNHRGEGAGTGQDVLI